MKELGASLEGIAPIDVDLWWLQEEIDSFSDIGTLATESYNKHESGVVYAVKMKEADLKHLELHNSMGITSKATVPAEKIVGKVMVPADYTASMPGRSCREIEKLLSFSTGIYRVLSKKTTDPSGMA